MPWPGLQQGSQAMHTAGPTSCPTATDSSGRAWPLGPPSRGLVAVGASGWWWWAGEKWQLRTSLYLEHPKM